MAPATLFAAKRLVLGGTLDPENPLAALRGNALVWSNIFGQVEAYEAFLAAHVEPTDTAFKIIKAPDDFGFWKRGGLVRFPEPTGLNINMMPIRLFDDGASLPDACKPYLPIIQKVPVLSWGRDASGNIVDLRDRVAYLTIHETENVPAGKPQRRGGVHVERPGCGGRLCKRPHPILSYDEYQQSEYYGLAWGLGYMTSDDGIPVDGLYMASSVDDSCAVWPSLIHNPHEVTDAHGGLEHMRHHLPPEPYKLKAGELCWFTDRTPHESLPLPVEQPRQFFRLVIGPISTWYSRHNTENPLGVQHEAATVSHAFKH